MAISLKDTDSVPVAITGAVDAKGAPTAMPEGATFAWAIESGNGLEVGTFEVDPTDGSKGTFHSGMAGAVGVISVEATFADNSTLKGVSDEIDITAGAPAAFTIQVG